MSSSLTLVSVVIPVRDEQENVLPQYEQLSSALKLSGRPFELLFVDDGSRDATLASLRKLAAADSNVRALALRRNFGQSAAMLAGIEAARGDVIVTIDGDLQNDAHDIPMMLAKLEEGFDVVHGWRKDRKDAWLHRKLPSRIANRVISSVTGFPIHDLGCTLKAIRTEIAQEIELYGEMHRFIPILAHGRGARCVEVETRHHPRIHGKTKYGLSRTIRVLLDLCTVVFLLQFAASPMKLFGRIAAACFSAAFISEAAVAVMKLSWGFDVTGNPLFVVGAVAFLAGLQFMGCGLIAELCVRIYYSQPARRPYAIREEFGGEAARNPGSLQMRRSA
jgi:glycosyltransferase involved in cell wall biosynthesis